MASRIVGRTCSVQNAFWFDAVKGLRHLTAWLALLLAVAGAAFGAEFESAAGQESYAFNLVTHATAEGLHVDEVLVRRPGTAEPVQRLAVGATLPPVDARDLLFQDDINFDGYKDLYVITARGTANSRALYWLYDPRTDRFHRLGEFPVLSVDHERQVLSSYERGGHGGLIHIATQYRFIDGKLTVVRQETQEPVSGSERYRRIVRERRGDRLRVVERELVAPP